MVREFNKLILIAEKLFKTVLIIRYKYFDKILTYFFKQSTFSYLFCDYSVVPIYQLHINIDFNFIFI